MAKDSAHLNTPHSKNSWLVSSLTRASLFWCQRKYNTLIKGTRRNRLAGVNDDSTDILPAYIGSANSMCYAHRCFLRQNVYQVSAMYLVQKSYLHHGCIVYIGSHLGLASKPISSNGRVSRSTYVALVESSELSRRLHAQAFFAAN